MRCALCDVCVFCVYLILFCYCWIDGYFSIYFDFFSLLNLRFLPVFESLEFSLNIYYYLDMYFRLGVSDGRHTVETNPWKENGVCVSARGRGMANDRTIYES